MSDSTSNNLTVTIRSREKKLFDGVANSITSNNDKGIFDILPKHANLISLIHDYVIIDLGLKTEQKIELKSGLLSIIANKIDIYVVNS